MKRKRLLIADDSEMNRAILENVLNRDFEIIEATNGKEVMLALENYGTQISALLLDIIMPEMDGFAVLEEMKRRNWMEDIPVIMISAETSSAYIDRAFALGAIDYISRPFVMGIVRRRIINAILLHTKKQHLEDVAVDWLSHRKQADVMQELYNEQDALAARMTGKLEEANVKQDFFKKLSDEMWFEYVAEPSALHLSRGAVEQTGLPEVILNPFENKEFLEAVGMKPAALLKERLPALPKDKTEVEFITEIALGGKPCQCRLNVLILGAKDGRASYSALLGRVVNIDEGYRRMKAYAAALEEPLQEEQILLPILAGRDSVLKIKKEQVHAVLQGYRRLFETVRLVDPEICMQISAGAGAHKIEKSKYCYSVWGKRHRCERCISQETICTGKRQTKIETTEQDVYYVSAIRLEIDGVPYSLECVNPLHLDDITGVENEHVLNQLLLRNRQVYIDSGTRIYNRRYYDDRIRNLNGEYALAMMDVDNFKQINDKFGHTVGDEMLYRIAQTIRSILRSQDAFVRYGGDEFFILFHQMPEAILERKLQAICQTVQKIEISQYGGLRLSVSVGGVYADGQVSDLIKKADIALYEAKKTKNCAVLFKEAYE